jgi:hypothetical protein
MAARREVRENMASSSTGIILMTGTISFGNEWLQTQKLNFRIPVATMFTAVFLNGVDKISPKAATGLAVIAMITVLLTPLNGKSPLQEVLQVLPVNPRK